MLEAQEQPKEDEDLTTLTQDGELDSYVFFI